MGLRKQLKRKDVVNFFASRFFGDSINAESQFSFVSLGLGMAVGGLVGISSGATGNPAILAYANQLAPTGKPDIGYAMIFPGVGTILKIILVQVMVAMGVGGAAPPG